MDFVNVLFSLVAVMIWPVTIFAVVMVLRGGVRKERKKVVQGNARAAALLVQVRSHS